MESTLEKIGLSKDETHVYSTLVQFGTRTIGQIQSYYKQPLDVITATLNSLASKGYVKEIKARNSEGTSFFIPIPPQIKLTEDVSQRLENELTALSDNVKNDWNNTMKAFRDKLAVFHGQITQSADEHSQVIGSISKQFLDSISTTVASGKTDINDTIVKLKSETSAISTTHSENLGKTVQRIQENISGTFESTISRIGEHHESFKNKIEETLENLKIEHHERVQGQLDNLNEKIAGIKEALSVQTQEFNVITDEKKALVDTTTDEVVKKLISDSSVVARESTKKLSDTLNDIISNYEVKLDEYQAKVKEILISLNDELKKLEEATTNRIRTSIDKSKETAVNILKNNEKHFVDLLNSTKVDSVEKLGSLISQTEAKTEEMKTKLGEDLTSYLSDFKKNSDDLLSLLNEGIENGFKQFEANLASSIEDVSNQIKQFIEDIMSVFRESTNQYLDKLSKTTSKYEKNLKDRKEKFASAHEEFKGNFNEQLGELKTSVLSNIEKNVQDNDEAIKTLLSEKENKFKSEVETFLEDFSRRGRDVRDEVPNLVQINYQESIERLKALETDFKAIITNLESLYEDFQGVDMKQFQKVFGKDDGPRMAQIFEGRSRDISSLKESLTSKIEDMNQTFSDSMSSLSVDIFEKMNSKLEELSRFTNDTIQSTGQSFDDSRNEISKQFATSLGDMKNAISETYTTYDEQFNELQGNSTKALSDVIGAESKAFSDVTNSIKKSLDELLVSPDSTSNNEESQIYQTIKDGLDSLQTTKNDILDLMKKNNTEVTKNLQETLKANIDDHSKLVTKATSSMDDTMKSLQSEFEGAKKALDTDVSVALDEAAKNYSVQTAKVEEEINNLIEQEVQQFIESTEDVLSELNVSPEKSSQLDEAIDHTKGELQNLGKTYPSMVKEDTDAFSASLETALKGFQASTQQEIDAMYLRVKDDLQKSYSRMNSDFANNGTELQNEFDKEKNDYELNITHQINSFVTNSDSNSSALVTNVQGTKDALIEAISAGDTAVKSDLANMEKTLSDLFESYLNEIQTKLDSIEGETKAADANKEQYVTKLMGFKEDIIRTSQQEIETIDSSVSETLSSIPGKISGALDATGDSMKLIRNVLSLGEGIEPNPVEDTWIVYGKEQVNSALMGLISRSKRGVTLITPNLDWVKTDLLESDPTISRKRLHFFYRDDPDNVLSKLVELNAKLGVENMQMKNTAGNPNIFICVRDGTEEGFFGYIGQAGEPIVLMTFNDIMVGMIDQISGDYKR